MTTTAVAAMQTAEARLRALGQELIALDAPAWKVQSAGGELRLLIRAREAFTALADAARVVEANPFDPAAHVALRLSLENLENLP